MIRDFLLILGITQSLAAWIGVVVFWLRLSKLTTAWNHYHGKHEIRIEACERRLELGFWAPGKAGGDALARERERAAAGDPR